MSLKLLRDLFLLKGYFDHIKITIDDPKPMGWAGVDRCVFVGYGLKRDKIAMELYGNRRPDGTDRIVSRIEIINVLAFSLDPNDMWVTFGSVGTYRSFTIRKA